MAIQQRAVLTRARVLTAAAEVFARTGFLAASMNDIVDQAGVTKGAVYFHFPSKEALAVAIVEEQFHQWPTMVDSLAKHSPNAMVSIVALTYEVGSRFRDWRSCLCSPDLRLLRLSRCTTGRRCSRHRDPRRGVEYDEPDRRAATTGNARARD